MCKGDTYNSKTNAEKCTPCPEGRVSEPGSRSEGDCKPGNFYFQAYCLIC